MRTPFLGQVFVALDAAPSEALRVALAHHPQPLSGYTYAVLTCWHPVFRYAVCSPEPDAVLIAFIKEDDGKRHLLQPVGPLSPRLAADLVREAARLDYPLLICGVSAAFVQANADLLTHFSVSEQPDFANYIYSANDLATLGGHKYAKKRNLLAQAERALAWSSAPLTPADADACFAIARQADEARRPVEGALALMRTQERRALETALCQFAQLELLGTAVRVDGQIAAFSIYEPANPEMMVVYFERALRQHKGLYQLVTREAARAIAGRGVALINREEDLGDPGLRQAKRSYFPLRLEPQYMLTFRG